MKVTAKQYQAKVTYRSELKNYREVCIKNEDYNMAFSIEKELELMEEMFFDLLPTVNVSYYIGSRSYYEGVVKIGKAYFIYGRKMTKGRGYWNITEIEEITEDMKHSMMSDSYYY